MASLWLLIFGVAAYLIWKLKEREFPNYAVWVLACLVLAGSLGLYSALPAERLQVDRWSVTTQWWQALFNGDNPYLSVSHLGNSPGPFPGLFLAYLPFYFLGETGWLWTAIVVFALWLFRKSLWPLLLVFLMPGFLWEGATRSNLFFNGTWILLVLVAPSFKKIQNPFVWAALLGWAICTRSLTLFPLAAFVLIAHNGNLVSALKNKNLWTLSAIAVLTAASPFIGLSFYFPAFWAGFNPITFQATAFMPSWMIATLFFIGIFTIPKINNGLIFSLYLTRWLSCLFMAYWLWVIYTNGWSDAFFNSQADLSYFNFVIPFGLAAMYFSAYPEANKALFIPETKDGPSYT